MDYYSILGVPKNASEKDLKKAYKKASMQHHPDRGGDEAKFKEINEAYSTLRDPQKRAMYDNPQPRFDTSQMHGGHGFEDMFGSMFGGGFQQPRRRPKNRDIQIQYKINLEDCFTGRGITIQYSLPSGRDETLDIRIPEGVQDGDVVKIAGFGDDSIPNLPRGDLLVRIGIIKKKNWDINKLDLIHSTEVNVLDLITGTEIIINSPEGKNINLKIPKGTQPNTTFSIQGYGILDSRTGRRGSIYVKVKGNVPNVKDEALIRQIHEFKNKLYT